MLQYFGRNIKISKNSVTPRGINLTLNSKYCKKEDDKCVDGEGSSGSSVSVRHNFHQECEEGLNEQINCELYASYTYFCMANCLSRPDVALFGFAKYFSSASREELEHAQKLVNFVNMRGGTVQLCDVLKPEPGEYQNPEFALEESISLEKNILKSLEDLHKKATTHNDAFLTDYLETHFFPEQYQGIQQLAEMLSRVRRVGPGLGIMLLDMDLMRSSLDIHGPKH